MCVWGGLFWLHLCNLCEDVHVRLCSSGRLPSPGRGQQNLQQHLGGASECKQWVTMTTTAAHSTKERGGRRRERRWASSRSYHSWVGPDGDPGLMSPSRCEGGGVPLQAGASRACGSARRRPAAGVCVYSKVWRCSGSSPQAGTGNARLSATKHQDAVSVSAQL